MGEIILNFGDQDVTIIKVSRYLRSSRLRIVVPKDQIQLTQVQKDNLVNLKKKGLKACLYIYQSAKLPIF